MPNNVYINRETPTTWAPTGGDLAISINGLAAGAAQVGAELDRGAGAIPAMFEWRLVVDGFGATPVIGELVWLYFAMSDGTERDGDLPATDSAVTNLETLPNLTRADNLRVKSTTAATKHVVSGQIWIPSRYISAVVHNDTGQAFASNNNHKIVLTAVPDQIQD